MSSLNFHERPILVFWETTRACLLACRHCRAEAVEKPAPGELGTQEAIQFIESLTLFGKPYPVLILTGGDVLMRQDIFELAKYARGLGIPIGMAPSVTPKLTNDAMDRMREVGVKVVSISLDGARGSTHDKIRGINGHFEETVRRLRDLVEAGFEVQVNTTVMKENAPELPAIAQILQNAGVKIWEVFFLIEVGRGRHASELTPEECEDVCHFLYDASMYNLVVRTVEAPFFRRIVAARKSHSENPAGPQQGALYNVLSSDLTRRLGQPFSPPRAQTSGTRDGKGIVFVGSTGDVYPAGFLPLNLGNVRKRTLPEIYRDHPVLQDIRTSRFTGICGTCDYRDACGGSRSRAYAKTGDALACDPACIYTLAT